MRAPKLIAMILAALCLALAALAPAGSAAAAKPAWTLTATPEPANFAPGGKGEYVLVATNVGAEKTSGLPSELAIKVPAGLTVLSDSALNRTPGTSAPTCTPPPTQEVICKTSEPIGPGQLFIAQVQVKATSAPAGAPLIAEASIGGGNGGQISATATTQIQKEPVPFDFLPGFRAPLTDEEGQPMTLAGSHPYQQTVSFGFPTQDLGSGLTNDGHPRNLEVELPRGLIGNPAATPVLCTEAELVDAKGCPLESQVGVIDITSLIGVTGNNTVITSNLYNMVPPPGSPAELATNAADAGVYIHILAGVRSDGDYGVEAITPDVIAFGQQPIFNVGAQIWGDPSGVAHDSIRGECRATTTACPRSVDRQRVAFLTLPGDCPGAPPLFKVLADTWEQPSPPFAPRETTYASADRSGASPAPVKECGDLEFEPTIQTRLTTNLTDSPSGLEVIVRQPQEAPHEEPLSGRAKAILKDAVISFPAGLAVNPSQAAGLGACSEDEIGFRGPEGGTLRFTKAPQSCPAAAKIGSLEATSPLLVRRNAQHEVERDPQSKEPILEALHGSIYIASPFANPFGKLIAVYLAIEDEKTGIIAKLAGEGQLDPQSGQITTRFLENPELPIEDIRARIFGGPRGALITPPTCGPYATTTQLTPWSAPEGKDAFPTASVQPAATPLGGPCPATEAQLPSAFKLNAGTQSPAAGKYSPLLFKLSRQDGTQRLAKIESTLPRGLIARLAGVGTCSEAQIAKARSREEPQKGALEQADPSCPASAQLGTVIGAAGAGPTPYYTSGHAYLAGPYKGAPISIVAIVPAVAGPFDLGVVVSRIAVYLDPVSAEVRAVSDPLPATVQGVPLDLRSVALRADRPSFTLNPTSCAEKSFGGQAITTLSQATPISQRFQVGGCKSLPYKPKMSVRLFGPTHRGAHPRLKAVLSAKAGEANTAAASFTLPRSEFIDQAHFRTICTRVQFAADQCPAGSVYGHVKVWSPLVDYPLVGPAYLRSSTHELPDLVVALHGPPSQPIEIDAAGRVDSLNGGLRVRFEEVPDAPVSKLIFNAQGAAKGLFQNSTNICKGIHRATLKLDAQNGKVSDSQPKLVAQCAKAKKKGKGGGRR